MPSNATVLKKNYVKRIFSSHCAAFERIACQKEIFTHNADGIPNTLGFSEQSYASILFGCHAEQLNISDNDKQLTSAEKTKLKHTNAESVNNFQASNLLKILIRINMYLICFFFLPLCMF